MIQYDIYHVRKNLVYLKTIKNKKVKFKENKN